MEGGDLQLAMGLDVETHWQLNELSLALQGRRIGLDPAGKLVEHDIYAIPPEQEQPEGAIFVVQIEGENNDTTMEDRGALTVTLGTGVGLLSTERLGHRPLVCR
jgi:hypothetical protein